MTNLASTETKPNPETPEPPVARVGKIARLPEKIRIELNRRLADGETAKTLLDWLNSRPETQPVLAAEFGGRAINEQNLSEWRRGGFVDWQRHEEMRSWIQTLEDESGDLFEAAELIDLDEQVETLTLMQLGRVLRAPFSPETKAHGHFLLSVLREVSRMRQVEAACERAEIERERWEFEKLKTRHEVELQTMRTRTFTHQMEKFQAEYDQPKPKAAEAEPRAENAPEATAKPAGTNGNQALSSQIKPAPIATKPQPERPRAARGVSPCIQPDQGKSRSTGEPAGAAMDC